MLTGANPSQAVNSINKQSTLRHDCKYVAKLIDQSTNKHFYSLLYYMLYQYDSFQKTMNYSDDVCNDVIPFSVNKCSMMMLTIITVHHVITLLLILSKIF